MLEAKDPPCRAVWVTAGNPLAMLPDARRVERAFRSVDFSVVVDTHPTDTTAAADLVLPTLTLLEDDDVLGAYGHHWLRVSEPAVQPPPGPRHELHILQGLAGRLGLGAVLAGSVEDWKRRVTRTLAAAGADLEALRAGKVRRPDAPCVLFADRRFGTATGKVDLIAEPAGPPPRTDAEWPLTLLAVSTPAAQSSQWAIPRPGTAVVRVHPSAAAGCADGELAELRSRRDVLRVIVRHDASVRPDVALMAKGGHLADGTCANVLVEAVATDDGGGAAFYDEPVRLCRRA
jgi:anaerobic selenocysteine-containing dehydrogenase